MQYKQIEHFRSWFKRYVSGFYGDDDYVNANLKLKEEHTLRVCGEMAYLAKELGMNDNDRMIAEAIALFHDLGRFPQFVKYQTYCDHRSTDHSCLALGALRQNKTLDILEDNEKQIIETAIKMHGIKMLPEDLDKDTVTFAKLIRDADKIDIYFVALEAQKQYQTDPDNFMLEIEYPEEPHCSAEVLNAVINGELIDYAALRTLNDMRLIQLGWVYDVNFIPAFKRIKERGYLENICGFLTCTDHIERVKKAVLDHVDSRINDGS